jgi:4-amino-4-deoxychorismate lyase
MNAARTAADPEGCHLLVSEDGDVVERDGPFLRADDLGALRGDGIFEAFLVVDGSPDLLDEHLARLERSAAMTGLRLPPDDRWRRGVEAAIAAWRGGPEMVVRFIVTRGVEGHGRPTTYLLADPVNPTIMAQRLDGISVLSLERGLDPDLAERAPWLLMGAKTLSYAVNMAAQRWAQEHGADDIVFVGPGGVILEGPTSSVVVARGRRLSSPPPSLGILASISLGGLFAAAPAAGWDVGYDELSVADLLAADAVWLVSSIRLAARVHTLDGKALPEAGAGFHAELAALVGPRGAVR